MGYCGKILQRRMIACYWSLADGIAWLGALDLLNFPEFESEGTLAYRSRSCSLLSLC